MSDRDIKPANVLRIYPCTVKQARKWVREYHRHLKRLAGGRFACALGGGAVHV